MTTITIHDSLMGTGKSTAMIDRINNSDSDTRWIVVAPFLKECHRYAGTILDEESEDKQRPKKDEHGNIIYTGEGCSTSGRTFHHPTTANGSKVDHIQSLVEQGYDVVTTHAALKLFKPETIAAIKDAGYSLVIDESLEVISPLPLTPYRRNILLDSRAVYVDDEGLLRWSDNDRYSVDKLSDDEIDGTGYSWDRRVKSLCDNGSLILVEDKQGKRDLFMWEYPIDFLRAFNSIDILTYMFEGSIMQKYLSFHNMPYTIEYGTRCIPDSSLISIVDSSKMNRPGERENIFSATDSRKITKSSATAKDMRTNMEHFFNNNTYGASKYNDRMWTCLKESITAMKGKGYTKQYVPFNTKAVNDYANVSHMAYIYNVFIHPEIYKYLKSKGEQYAPDERSYALAELLQWVYRGRIRNSTHVSLYIPSKRMRDMLVRWVENKE